MELAVVGSIEFLATFNWLKNSVLFFALINFSLIEGSNYPPIKKEAFNLEMAVEDDEAMQDFESEPLPAGGDHSQKVKAPPAGSGYGSKDCVNSSSSTAVSRFKELQPYMMNEEHPIKQKLDDFFSKSRIILNLKTLKKAGFRNPKVRDPTQLIVTSHPDFPGYIFKLYIDAQRPRKGRPEHYYWLLRIKGARMIQEWINEKKAGHLFKTPKKWLYLLPEEPVCPKDYAQKNFILVQEDMELYDEEVNEEIWGSGYVTEDRLVAVFSILQELGLQDCAKPDNIPFSRDGRIAFIDTQTYGTWPVNYRRLTPFLSSKNKKLWRKLRKEKSKYKKYKAYGQQANNNLLLFP